MIPGFKTELDAERWETRLVDLLQTLTDGGQLAEDLLVIQRDPQAVAALADMLRAAAAGPMRGQLHLDLAPHYPTRVRVLTEQERRPPAAPRGRKSNA